MSAAQATKTHRAESQAKGGGEDSLFMKHRRGIYVGDLTIRDERAAWRLWKAKIAPVCPFLV